VHVQCFSFILTLTSWSMVQKLVTWLKVTYRGGLSISRYTIGLTNLHGQQFLGHLTKSYGSTQNKFICPIIPHSSLTPLSFYLPWSMLTAQLFDPSLFLPTLVNVDRNFLTPHSFQLPWSMLTTELFDPSLFNFNEFNSFYLPWSMLTAEPF